MNINNPEHSYVDEKGVSRHDSLEAYKAWENVYLKYDQSNEPKDKKLFDRDSLKTLLLIGYIAKIKNDAAVSQALAGDLVPIYNANRELSLEILKELPFLVPSTCYFLSRFFGWEGKNREQKKPFLTANRELIANRLGSDQGRQCLKFF